MARASTTAENQSLDGLTGGTLNLLAYTSLHTADPTTTGGSENSGGGYARQATSWGGASGGSKTNSTALTFTTAGLTPITHVGQWTAVTTGTYGIGAPLGSSVTAASITIAIGAITYSSS